MTKNFKQEEFRCKCGSCNEQSIDPRVVDILQDVRDYFNKPVTITSGTRCEIHNSNVGGAKNSYHKIKEDGFSKASDIQVKDTKPIEVYNYIDKKYPDTLGVILYKTFTHVDIRKVKYRKK